MQELVETSGGDGVNGGPGLPVGQQVGNEEKEGEEEEMIELREWKEGGNEEVL